MKIEKVKENKFWILREELIAKKLSSVYKRHIGNDFRFEMMITERIALSFFVRQWRPLSPPRGVGSRVCMQRNVRACTPRTWCTFRTYLYVHAGIYRLRTPRPTKRILLCSPMNVQPRDCRVSLPSGPLHLNCVDREVLNLATGNCFLLSSFPMLFYAYTPYKFQLTKCILHFNNEGLIFSQIWFAQFFDDLKA